MALIDSLEKNGNFLFRYRGQLPLLFFIIALPITYFHNYTFLELFPSFNLIISIASISLFLLGHIFRILIIGYRNEHTSGRNRHEQVAHQLNTKGWYSMVRHPLYFANFLIWIGLSIYLVNPLLSLLLCLSYWLFYERIILVEEKFLINKFGNEFQSWAAKVPAFVPNIFLFQKSGNQFSLKTICSNEYPSIISTATTFLVLILVRRVAQEGAVLWMWSDAYFAISILVFGLSFRFMKHRTSLFK
jgi:protein-S-isoprenylcysteine O-methyltransferase Ste14